MKNKIFTLMLLIGILNVGNVTIVNAQVFECQVIEDDFGYIVYQMKETSGTNIPTTSTVINDITFVLRYPTGSQTTSVICVTNDYNIADGLTGEVTFDGYDYFYWNSDAGIGFNPPNTWVINEWEDICKFKASGAAGSGLFEIAPNGWDGRGLNWNQTIGSTAVDFLPSIIGSGVTSSYSTIVYDLVWVGGGQAGFETDWFFSANWTSECGGTGSTPTSTNNIFIPDVTSESNYFPVTNLMGTMLSKNLRIASGAYLSVPETTGVLTIAEELRTYGTLKITPNANATVTGNTYIEGATSIEVQATSTGIGSFIDNGTITYGTSGTAKVQTYLTNAAIGTDFYIHQVGPTVNTTAGGGNGAVAQDFTISSGATYAYEWDEATTAWVNISQTAPILAGDGIILSSTDGTNHTLELTGTLNTGTISPSITTGGSSLELLSNPYPSSIDFDALASSNSGVINDKNWIWDPSGGSYVARAAGVGGAQHVQVGQAFFVETIANGTFDFTNNERAHSNNPFRDVIPDILKITAHGGETSYLDRTYIRFDEDGTSGYDVNLEAIHWSSMYDDATMLKSVAVDDTKLAINVLPTLDIQNEMISVPLIFSCGYAGNYILSADNIDSFETDVEIWLEDKLNNNIWINFANNPDYHFTAQPNDDENRFAIHFFGPTSINETEIDNVTIYSFQQYAYIVNSSNEQISEIIVYDLNGRKITNVLVSNQTLHKQYVSDKTGYYVIRVITNKNVYTEKVFIQNR